jgi:Zn-finger nucleic acid-binding protein
VQLVACRNCHAQYDLATARVERFACRCGATIENRPVEAHDAPVVRCGSCGAGLAGRGGTCTFCGSEVRSPSAAGPVCPECFARTPAGSRFCTACGVAFRPEPIQVETRELPCPVCSAPMASQALAGVAIGQCGSCQGLWIPEGHLEQLVRRAQEARRAPPGEVPAPAPRLRGGNPASRPVEYRRCPECDALMQRRNFRRSSGVIVDVCRRHGTWLDADELEQIAGYVLAHRRDADFVAGRPAVAPAAPEPTQADAAFVRILAEHRALEPRTAPEGPRTLLELLVGLLR